MSPSILVVDDDPEVCSSMTRMLNRLGMEAVSAETAAAALNLLVRRRYDVAIIDLYLRSENGMELAGAIRQMRPDTALLIMSGAGTIEDYLAVQTDRGIIDFINKPFRKELLVALLKEILANRGEGGKQMLRGNNGRCL